MTLDSRFKPYTHRVEAPWAAAQKIEAWAGELRVNLLRLAAIAAFYGHHLVNVYLLRMELPPRFHLGVSALAGAWTAAAVALHLALARRVNPPALRYAAVAWDAAMIATLLTLHSGAASPFVGLLFLLVATAALRLDLRCVWAAAIAAILAFAFVCGHDKWVRGRGIERSQQIILALSLAAAGALAGQAVRQARRFALGYADRLRPEPPA